MAKQYKDCSCLSPQRLVFFFPLLHTRWLVPQFYPLSSHNAFEEEGSLQSKSTLPFYLLCLTLPPMPLSSSFSLLNRFQSPTHRT